MSDQRPAGNDQGLDQPATDIEAVAGGQPIHEQDRIPTFVLSVQRLAFGFTTYQGRLRFGLIILGLTVVAALALSGTRLLQILIDALDIFAFVGLFLVNWIGNGGVLVPVPGARFIGLLMIFQHAVILPSWEVFAVSGLAMGLGLLSYYIAGARTARAYQSGETEEADALAADSGLSSDPAQGRLKRSTEQAMGRARPTIERHGTWGMFGLCFAPTPLGTAAAFLGGVMGFGFARYLLASFAAKYLLAGIIVVAGLVLADQAASISIWQS